MTTELQFSFDVLVVILQPEQVRELFGMAARQQLLLQQLAPGG